MNTRKILVVEDERPLAEVIKTKLTKSNFTVVTVSSVEEALQALEKNDDLVAIWLDHYLLGKEDGLDLVAKIKEHDGKWENIPIFLVSNTASADKVSTYMRLGVKKYYVKSNHRLDEIIGEIESYIEHGE